jgi:hypothetical protein
MTRIFVPKDVAALAVGANKVAAKLATNVMEETSHRAMSARQRPPRTPRRIAEARAQLRKLQRIESSRLTIRCFPQRRKVSRSRSRYFSRSRRPLLTPLLTRCQKGRTL